MSQTDPRPVPIPDGDSERYWQAASEGRLVIQRCETCGRHQSYPRLMCTACGTLHPSWVEVSGVGTVYSYTVNHRAAAPWAADRVPYIVALIDLAEGPRLMANVDADPAEIEVGMAVSAWFEEIAPGVRLPQFRPMPSPSISRE